ncbi:MAG TPA: pyridoxamine 5'-phosphate oxidase family protein, partial [Acetobacteraceae bacterium]|nr:pyridoxamine 5'-phosphate oxidase family protein [Acetobacteraceae bacterium]
MNNMTSPAPDYLDLSDPARFCDSALSLLARGVRDRRSAFHVINLATLSPTGLPRVRNVVLRGCEPRHALLVFHTDRRSEKFQDLGTESHAEIAAYDSGHKLQLRLAGPVRLHYLCDRAAEAWAHMTANARAVYAHSEPPGALKAKDDAPAPLLNDEAAYQNFVICHLHLRRLDILFLKAGGHL